MSKFVGGRSQRKYTVLAGAIALNTQQVAVLISSACRTLVTCPTRFGASRVVFIVKSSGFHCTSQETSVPLGTTVGWSLFPMKHKNHKTWNSNRTRKVRSYTCTYSFVTRIYHRASFFEMKQF
jgi:hypothetical protein